jgi:hypothetical protein
MKEIKILLILVILLLPCESFAQTVYELTPGTKGNEINITVANVSETNQATNVNMLLTKKSSSLVFNKEEEMIETLEAKAEAKALFTFDVNRYAPINQRDTINFMITDANGLIVTKSFIFSYTGPKEFKLEQNFPNPFNPTTTIQYQLPASPKSSPKERTSVTLIVYDILGSEVITLINEEQEAGYKEVKFNANNIASGIYIYRLQAKDYVSTKKMMVVK